MNLQYFKHGKVSLPRYPLKSIALLLISLFFLSWGNVETIPLNVGDPALKSTIVERSTRIIKEGTPSDTLVVSTAQVILLIPTAREVDSLIKIWGEDKFYEIAYDENRKLSRVYGALDKTKTPYQSSDASVIYITEGNKTVKKSSLPYAWGALNIKKDGSYDFKNPIDFLLSLK